MIVQVGQMAPAFSLPNQDGKIHSLSDYRGQWVLIYFYPKDDTTGCTAEACSFRDNLPDFNRLQVQVFGISVDSSKKHKKFIEKYGLNFILLSDVDKKVVNDYGVWAKKKFMGREYMGTLRKSFLVKPDGTIAKVYETVKPETHVAEVLSDLREMM